MASARILLVDDEELYLNAACRLLSRRGYDVVSAGGPLQALEIVRKSEPFDVVVSDVMMPEMRGTHLVREIAQLSPGTGTLLMSGGPIDPAEAPDGVPVLRKPLSTENLIHAVEASLQRSAILKAELARNCEITARLLSQNRQLRSETEEIRRESIAERERRKKNL